MNKRQIKLGNRIAGLIAITLGTGVAISLNLEGHINTVADAVAVNGCGALLTTVGIGDLITGQYDYLFSGLIDYIRERRNIRYLL
jgi:uncharacterized membrane protein